MSSIDALFLKLRQTKQTALIPFITAGDPNIQFTSEVLHQLSKAGADLCEIGIPYSDPVADGPVIQASYTRALDNGIDTDSILATLSGVAKQESTPLVTMISYAIIYRHSPEKYIQKAKAAGIAGAIVPDLPAEEAKSFATLCRAEDFSLIQLVAPTTSRDRILKIADCSSGFLYYVSVAGITGERKALPADLVDRVSWIRETIELPVCVGFGISGPEQVKQLAPIADGLIVGSAIVRRMAKIATEPKVAVLQSIYEFVKSLSDARTSVSH